MASPERIYALCDAVRYVSINAVPGDIVECGVWRGGCMMAAARTLLELGDTTRTLYLFDTFDGMTKPGDRDVAFDGIPATVALRQSKKEDANSVWCYAPLGEVQEAIRTVGYPIDRIRFVRGRVEETLPLQAPDRVALLRLDTDWYESTRHELVHLFPRLSPGGVLIIDDYGHWKGARQAVDEYLRDNKVPLLLNRTDYTGRIGVKVTW
jgi:hypothetical protein